MYKEEYMVLYISCPVRCVLSSRRQRSVVLHIYVLAHSIAVEETMFVGTIASMNLVHTLATAHQVNTAVMINVP